MQNKASGEGEGEEAENGVQEAKPVPAVEDVQSGGLVPTVYVVFSYSTTMPGQNELCDQHSVRDRV